MAEHEKIRIPLLVVGDVQLGPKDGSCYGCFYHEAGSGDTDLCDSFEPERIIGESVPAWCPYHPESPNGN